MVRIPISKTKKLTTITIGTKNELANLYGDFVIKELDIVPPRQKVIASEYSDGQITFSFM